MQERYTVKVKDTTEQRNLFSGGVTLPLHPRGDGKQILERAFIKGYGYLAMTVSCESLFLCKYVGAVNLPARHSFCPISYPKAFLAFPKSLLNRSSNVFFQITVLQKNGPPHLK
jgi:hypothetical protein